MYFFTWYTLDQYAQASTRDQYATLYQVYATNALELAPVTNSHKFLYPRPLRNTFPGTAVYP